MTEWAMKRFWTGTDVVAVDDGFAVHLDGRGVRTPAKAPLLVPTRSYADLVAAEWDAQGDKIDPTRMPFTRLANSAIDNVAINFPAVAGMLAEYGGSDLVCYRADGPRDLVARQEAAWDPLLAWAGTRFGAALNVGPGVMFIEQPAASIAALTGELHRMTAFELAAFHDLVTIPGSLVIALAAIHHRAPLSDLWSWSRIDEDWQAEQWGKDEEAADLAEAKRRDFETAFTAFSALKAH